MIHCAILMVAFLHIHVPQICARQPCAPFTFTVWKNKDLKASKLFFCGLKNQQRNHCQGPTISKCEKQDVETRQSMLQRHSKIPTDFIKVGIKQKKMKHYEKWMIQQQSAHSVMQMTRTEALFHTIRNKYSFHQTLPTVSDSSFLALYFIPLVLLSFTSQSIQQIIPSSVSWLTEFPVLVKLHHHEAKPDFVCHKGK